MYVFLSHRYSVHPEDEGSKALQNIGILLQQYTTSQPTRPQLHFAPCE